MHHLSEADVVVIGGGVSGMNAALAASLTGASVTVVERAAFLGGTATGGMVAAFNGFFWHDTQVTGGTSQLILDQLEHNGGGRGFHDYTAGKLTDSPFTFKVYPFDPEVLKTSLDELVRQHNIQVIHHCQAFTYNWDDHGCEVTVLGPTQTHAIRAKQVIDATAQGSIAVKAGASLYIPVPEDRQPMTQMMRVSNVDHEVFAAVPRAEKKQLVQKGIDAGRFFYRTIAHSESPVNNDMFLLITAVHGLDGTDPLGLSAAEVEGRQQAITSLDYLKQVMPGFEKASLVQLAPWIGQRESVRVEGYDTLTAEAVARGADHPQAISYGGGPIDRHIGDGVRLVPPERPFAVPLGTLIPKNTHRLTVTGRIISSDAAAMDGLRHMGGMMPVGHAAGVLSALAALNDTDPIEVPYASVREKLTAQGAILSV